MLRLPMLSQLYMGGQPLHYTLWLVCRNMGGKLPLALATSSGCRLNSKLTANSYSSNWILPEIETHQTMGVWQGVAIDSLKFHPGLPCLTFLLPMGLMALQPYSRFRSDPLIGVASPQACGRLQPFWTPHGVHLSCNQPSPRLVQIS
jgi:hypothetical protein